jgi:hypothetical protein
MCEPEYDAYHVRYLRMPQAWCFWHDAFGNDQETLSINRINIKHALSSKVRSRFSSDI